MKANILTLGCKVNRYESEVVAKELALSGWQIGDSLEYADIYIINTCAVTAEASSKSRQMIARAKKYNPAAGIYIIGCGSEFAPESYAKEQVVYITGTNGKEKIVDIINKDYPACFNKDIVRDTNSPYLVSRTRVFVKIQDGCDNACSYCIIPYLRGGSVSRPIDEIVAEAHSYAKDYKEIVLVGINISLYGKDIGTNLSELINALAAVPCRVRLSSFYIEGINEQLMLALQRLHSFCDHFHLSVQSGDDAILKDMNRRYNTAECLEKIDLIRKYFPNCAIAADLIVGYPTENEARFDNTLRFIEQARFSDIHCFIFSPRKGTSAYQLSLPNKSIAKQRQAILLSHTGALRANFLKENLNKEHEVLFEEVKDGIASGYTRNYIRAYSAKPYNGIQNVVSTSLYKDGLLVKGE